MAIHRRALWRITGRVRAVGAQRWSDRVVLLAADDFDCAHNDAPAALGYNWTRRGDVEAQIIAIERTDTDATWVDG